MPKIGDIKQLTKEEWEAITIKWYERFSALKKVHEKIKEKLAKRASNR